MKTALIVSVIAGLIVLAVWLRKKSAKPSTTTSTPGTPMKGKTRQELSRKGIISNPFTVVLLGLLGYLVWIFSTAISSAWTALTGAFASIGHHWSGWFQWLHWWSLILAVIVLAIVLDLSFFKNGNQTSWGARWKGWRNHFYFALLWAGVIAVINVGLAHLDVWFWTALWTYKGEGTWFFWLVMALLTAGMWLAVNQPKEAKALKACGRIFVLLGLVFWTTAWAKADRHPAPASAQVALNTAPLPKISVPAVVVRIPQGPSARWSKDETFPLKRNEWSPRILPGRYEADEGPVEVMIDGNPKNVRQWDVKTEDSSVNQITVPSYVQFIQIRSTVKETTVDGTPQG